MKTKIPDSLKEDLPHNKWGKVLSATPVVMTVVSTLLAGLASSEMTRAQYSRAYGAQLQSKAGDQWSYFQAKKLRGAMQRNSLELLQAIGEIGPSPRPELEKVPAPAELKVEPKLGDALKAVEKQQPEEEISELLKLVPDADLAATLRAAKDIAIAFDSATAPANAELDRMQRELPAGDKAAAQNLSAARMRLNGARYDVEAKLNQVIANLYELQVRKANLAAERHHRRSGKFFIGMLSAQAAVIVATLAMAAQKRSFLWSISAVAGIAAVVFAIYVYLNV